MFQFEKCAGGVTETYKEEDYVVDNIGRDARFFYLGDEQNAGGSCLSMVWVRESVGLDDI